MKKIIAVLMCIALLVLAGCTQKPQNKKDIIATSFYPVYIFTINLTDGIDAVDVQCMAEQNTGCLHDYTITSKDARLLNDCSLFIINGAGMEGFVEDLYSSVENLNVLDSSVGASLLCGEHHHGEIEDDHSHHHEYNSHIWMSVENAKIQIKNIADGLIEAFPQYEIEISDNYKRYSAELSSLSREIEGASAQVKGKKVIAFHDAYEYLAEDMGFIIYHTIESDENGEPSARKLSFISDEIKREDITALLVEPQYSGSAANILKNETGIEVYTLNPVLNGEKNKTSYEDIMRENIDVILKAVK